jgi:hypothetical protein
LGTLASTLWTVLAGGALAVLLGRWRDWPQRGAAHETVKAAIAPVRQITLWLGRCLERIDQTLRAWPAAGASLLMLVIVFGVAMLAGG